MQNDVLGRGQAGTRKDTRSRMKSCWEDGGKREEALMN